MNNLAQGSDCYGCSACASICPVDAINMIADDKGFMYPSVDLAKCISCGKCSDVCGKVHNAQKNRPDYGTFALQHEKEDVLKKSSSGGAFVAISDYILKENGIVAGAVFDPEKKAVKHIVVDSSIERDRMCGSKYVQSNIRGIFSDVKETLDSGRKVLFSGTPCQVSALYAFLGNNPSNLITIDLICHGSPSPLVFSSYLNYIEQKRKKKISDYCFRSKKYGYEYTTNIVFDDGSEDSSVKAKRLLKMYTLNMRESCYKCGFASGYRVGDITIGDLWKRPNNVIAKKHLGCSTILINTKKGEEIVESIKNDVILTPIDVNTEKIQALDHPVIRKEKCDHFWKDFHSGGIEKVLDKYASVSVRSFIFFYLIKYLHIFHCYSLIEKIKGSVTK